MLGSDLSSALRISIYSYNVLGVHIEQFCSVLRFFFDAEAAEL